MLEAIYSQVSWFHGFAFVSALFLPIPFYFRYIQTLKTKFTVLEQQYIHCVTDKEQFELKQRELQAELQKLQTEKTQLHGHCQQYQARLSEKQLQVTQSQQLWQQSEHALQASLDKSHALELELTDLKVTLKQRQEAFEKQINQLESAKAQLKEEFENVANQIFEEKTTRFNQQSQERIDLLLKPVQGELKGFRDKMEAIHIEELKQRASLKTELLHLQENNKTITEQAQQLTSALQGQKKTQGNWGELMLENVLDSAGLRVGYDYKREVSFSTDDGKFRPDVVVYLPQDRHLVIDAKTSLNAYTRYVNADNAIIADEALNEHAQAIFARIKELADKSYERLPGLNSPDVVVMFIPIESAFVAASNTKLPKQIK